MPDPIGSPRFTPDASAPAADADPGPAPADATSPARVTAFFRCDGVVTASAVEGEVAIRNPRTRTIDYSATLDASGAVTRFEMSSRMAGGPPSAPPVIERVSTMEDSVLITEVRRSGARDTTASGRVGWRRLGPATPVSLKSSSGAFASLTRCPSRVNAVARARRRAPSSLRSTSHRWHVLPVLWLLSPVPVHVPTAHLDPPVRRHGRARRATGPRPWRTRRTVLTWTAVQNPSVGLVASCRRSRTSRLVAW